MEVWSWAVRLCSDVAVRLCGCEAVSCRALGLFRGVPVRLCGSVVVWLWAVLLWALRLCGCVVVRLWAVRLCGGVSVQLWALWLYGWMAVAV